MNLLSSLQGTQHPVVSSLFVARIVKGLGRCQGSCQLSYISRSFESNLPRSIKSLARLNVRRWLDKGGVLLREVCGCMRNPFCFVFGFSAVRRIGSSSSPSFTFKKVKRSNSFQEHSSLQQLTSAKGVADVWMSVCTPLSWCCATALRT